MASKYWTFLDAVLNSLGGITGLPAPIMRYRVAMFQRDEPPLVIVAPGRKGDSILKQTFNKNVVYGYPIDVCYIQALNRLVGTGLQEYLDTRELLRDSLYNLALVNSGVGFDVNYTAEDAVDWGAFDKTNYAATLLTVTYSSAEQRTS